MKVADTHFVDSFSHSTGIYCTLLMWQAPRKCWRYSREKPVLVLYVFLEWMWKLSNSDS